MSYVGKTKRALPIPQIPYESSKYQSANLDPGDPRKLPPYCPASKCHCGLNFRATRVIYDSFESALQAVSQNS